MFAFLIDTFCSKTFTFFIASLFARVALSPNATSRIVDDELVHLHLQEKSVVPFMLSFKIVFSMKHRTFTLFDSTASFTCKKLTSCFGALVSVVSVVHSGSVSVASLWRSITKTFSSILETFT